MNKGEFGTVFAFSCGFDLSGKTTLSIEFWKPDNIWSEDTDATPSLTKTASVGNGALPTTAGAFADKRYAVYVWLAGDVDQVGTWSARVLYTDASQHLISDVAQFTINP